MGELEISVILSTYNRDYKASGMEITFLERAVNSVLQQTFSDFELILINDGSQDSSHETCLRFAAQDSRVHYVLHEKNSGLPAHCYNEGIALSKGRFIAFMFDDDYWFPNALNDLHQFFCERLGQERSLGMVYGLVEFINMKTNTPIRPYLGAEWDMVALRKENFLANCSVLILRNALDLTGGYDEHADMRRLCDWDLWIRLGMYFDVLRMPKMVGRVNALMPESLEMTVPLEMEKVWARQKAHRQFPLVSRSASLTERAAYCRSWLHFQTVNRWVYYLEFQDEMVELLMKVVKRSLLYAFLKKIYQFLRKSYSRG